MGHPVSKQEAVQMGLLTPDERPFPASELARRADADAPAGFLESGRGYRGSAAGQIIVQGVRPAIRNPRLTSPAPAP
jgi:hypothetical protein